MRTDDSADMRLDAVLENCIFYIFPMYEFLHSLGQKATWRTYQAMSAMPPKADIRRDGRDVRFSNRPSGVKRFQTIHHCSVDVAHGLALLFGIGTKALPAWDPRTRRNNLSGGLAVS